MQMDEATELENLKSGKTNRNESSSDDEITLDIRPDNDLEEERGVWANKLEFFLAIMGYTVGIGSVWRFPIICSRNGGGAFLIPFFFFLITSGGPLYYLEVCLGQFSGKSAGLAFEFCPLLKGIGILQVLLSLIVLWYATHILSWVLYFLYSCFRAVLPWSSCNNHWNTPACKPISELWSQAATNSSSINTTLYNTTSYNTTSMTTVATLLDKNRTEYSSSAYEFWEYKVIGRSSGLEEMGSMQIHLVICSLLAWVFCVSAVIKGVRTLGKVVYVTATAPYVFLTIMLIKGLTLDGAMDGLRTYLTPDFSKLLTVQVWLDAAIQVFYSLGPTWGGVITMSSYNRFHQKSFWSSTLCVVSAGFTAFYNGMVVFTLLGFMAKYSGRTVEEVAKQSGPGLAFIAFPTALSQMPVPHLWSVLFFLMLVAVVFDSLFGMFETVTSGIIDLFPEKLVSKRITVNIVTGVCFYLSGLPVTMNGGIYLFQLGDWYFSAFALLIGSLLECIALCWIYGTDRFARDIYIMTGRDVSTVLRIMWSIVIPIFIIITFIVMLTNYSAPDYGDGYKYSTTAISLGIFAGMIPVAAIFVSAGIVMAQQDGSLWERFKSSLTPSNIWIPNNKKVCETYFNKPYQYPDTLWRRINLNIFSKTQDP
ncbi:hypothetical protein ACF0H5_007504 [Mactra antiquata]